MVCQWHQSLTAPACLIDALIGPFAGLRLGTVSRIGPGSCPNSETRPLVCQLLPAPADGTVAP
jgi:hypothetical protein